MKIKEIHPITAYLILVMVSLAISLTMMCLLGLRVYVEHEKYIPICDNFQSMVVDAVCVDYRNEGSCHYIRIIKDCPNN